LLDVLEHIEDDRGFLGELVREKLAPEGQVLISVPAWPALYARHDAVLAHHRRYTPSAARALLRECGLAIRESGGLFHSLLPVRALQVLLERTLHGSKQRAEGSAGAQAATAVARWAGSERLTRWVQHGLKLDNALSRQLAARGLEVPGLTWWALCRRSH
jgi:hypothetical protein